MDLRLDTGDMWQLSPDDRPRGILSPTDREYLCGEKDYAQPQTDANRRQDIRERVLNGLRDISLLIRELPEKERKKLFETMEEDHSLDAIIASMIAFGYIGVDRDRQRFEACLERGVERGENHDKLFGVGGRATNVDVDLSIDFDPNIDRLADRLEAGDSLTHAEIGALVTAGRLEPEHLEQLREVQLGSLGPLLDWEKYD